MLILITLKYKKLNIRKRNKTMLSITNVLLFLTAYFVLFYGISRLANSYGSTKEGYLVANRNAGVIESALGATGCWLTGLGFYVAAQQFYNNGWVGFFWFTFPIFIGLLLFAWVTIYINRRVPNGFTTTEWIEKQYGAGVARIFQFVFIFASFGNIALTFTAAFKFINFVGIGHAELVTGLITLCTAIYSFKGGIKTSLITSSIQVIVNVILAFVLVYLGWHLIADKNLTDFLNGKKQIIDLFDPVLFWTFSYTAFLTFITGPTMAAAHHQKSFAQQNKQPWKAWVIAGPLYLAITTLMAFFGIMTLAWGGEVTDLSIAQLYLFKTIGVGALAIFGIMLLNVCCIIIDAHGSSVASIIANDYCKDPKKSVTWARWSMVGIAVITWLITVQNWDLTKIFFTFGILRTNLFLILIGILLTAWFTRRGIFWASILMCPTTIAIGLYGNINKIPELNAIAVTGAMFITPITAYLLSRLLKNKTV
jgi:Na+/proline symporter